MTSSTLKQYALYKYIALLLGIIFGFLQPTFFNKFFSQENFSFLILIYGWATYLIFFDLGFSKPIYALLRNKYINNKSLKNSLINILPFYNFILLNLAFIWFTTLIFISLNITNSFGVLFLCFFAIMMTFNIGLNYLENIYNALEEQIFFQKIDILRKCINLLSLFLIFIDKSFTTSMLASSILLGATYITSVNKICSKYQLHIVIFPASWYKLFTTIKSYWKKSYHYLIFSINETIIYNSGFILAPIFLTSFSVIQYGLWMKLFLAITLFMGVIGNTLIHKLTAFYFKNDISSSFHIYKISLLLSISVSVILTSVLLFLNQIIFEYWVDNKYIFEYKMFIALYIWTIFNAIQHCSGIFLMSTGKYFHWMKNISTVSLLFTSVLSVSLYSSHQNLSNILIYGGIVYGIFSIVYAMKSISLLKE